MQMIPEPVSSSLGGIPRHSGSASACAKAHATVKGSAWRERREENCYEAICEGPRVGAGSADTW
jgi:hypothetical protein